MPQHDQVELLRQRIYENSCTSAVKLNREHIIYLVGLVLVLFLFLIILHIILSVALFVQWGKETKQTEALLQKQPITVQPQIIILRQDPMPRTDVSQYMTRSNTDSG